MGEGDNEQTREGPERTHWRQRFARLRPQWRVLLPLGAATALLLSGLFLVWQAWLVYREAHDLDRAEQIRAAQVVALGAQIRQTGERVAAAVMAEPVVAALDAGDRDAATAALKAALPDAGEILFFTPNVDEVMAADLRRFGYARAQMLMQAQTSTGPAPVQMQIDAQRNQRLALAMPVRAQERTVAYAYVQLPFTPLLETLQGQDPAGARIDLRQGNGRGDLLIASVGNASSDTLADLGEPVAGSQFRLAVGAPDYFIVVARSLGLLVPSALLLLVAGFTALWLRRIGMQEAFERLRPSTRSKTEEVVLSDLLKNPVASAATPGMAAAADAPVRAEAGPAPTEVAIEREIFRAYDIRGVLGRTLTTGVARLIGRAIGSEARDRGLREIVVGRDGRLSGPDLSAALIEGLRESGCDVIDIGMAPTPVVYFAAYHLNTGSCVAVTGSHNPPDYNGFKIVLGGETLAEQAIQDLYARIVENRFVDGAGGLQALDMSTDYIERITSDVQVERRLKIVVDCGNGVPGMIAPAVLEGIGCEVVPLYCDVDGEFPNHHPDPSDPHNLQDLILSVRQTGADLGLAFDGDGDRLGVVTRGGEVIFPDRLLMLFAIDVLTRNPGAAIIYDVKCTGHLQPLILSHGGSPIMWKTGHSLIKAKMRQTEAQLAGEMSGHFFFAERWYGFDDGIYSAARLMEILAGDLDGRDPQEVFDSLPKGVSTPELKIPLHEGEHYRFVEAFQKRATFEGARLTTIDGVRADWPDGWGLVRASNTTPVLVLRFDADNEAALQRIQDAFRTQLRAVDPALPLPF